MKKHGGGSRWLRDHTSTSHRMQRENWKQGEALSPTPQVSTSSSEAPQMLLPNGDQVFKYLSLWEQCSFRLLWKVNFNQAPNSWASLSPGIAGVFSTPTLDVQWAPYLSPPSQILSSSPSESFSSVSELQLTAFVPRHLLLHT